MPAQSEVTILAPRVIRDRALPRRFRKRGAFTDLAGLDEMQLLARAFGVASELLAPAPLHYMGMTGRDPEGYCLFAYPVYLHARREELVLMTGEEFELTDQEADELIGALGAYFPELRIERTPDAMWFIIADEAPDMETTPLDRVLGENINDFLPRGPDAMRWLQKLNEMQMILFDAEVNQQREAEGRPPVNSLWIWGGGRLSPIRQAPWTRVVTNDPQALGIARRADIETRWLGARSLPADADPAVEPAEGGTLWVCARPEGAAEDRPAVSREQWRVLQDRLRSGAIEALTLIEPGYGELRVETAHTRSWLPWR